MKLDLVPTISTNFGASTLLSQLTGASGAEENTQHFQQNSSGSEQKPQGFLLTEGLTSQIISMETGSQVWAFLFLNYSKFLVIFILKFTKLSIQGCYQIPGRNFSKTAVS